MHYSAERVSSLRKPGSTFRRFLGTSFQNFKARWAVLEVFAIFHGIKRLFRFVPRNQKGPRCITYSAKKKLLAVQSLPAQLSPLNRSCVVTRGTAIARYSCPDSIQFQFAHNLLRAAWERETYPRKWPACRSVGRRIGSLSWSISMLSLACRAK